MPHIRFKGAKDGIRIGSSHNLKNIFHEIIKSPNNVRHNVMYKRLLEPSAGPF